MKAKHVAKAAAVADIGTSNREASKASDIDNDMAEEIKNLADDFLLEDMIINKMRTRTLVNEDSDLRRSEAG